MTTTAPEMMETSIPGLTEPRCMIVEDDGRYWLRIRLGTHAIDGLDIPEHRTLAGAVRWADEQGLPPTHWCCRDGHVSPIPSGIIRLDPA